MACLRFGSAEASSQEPRSPGPVSILKPVRGWIRVSRGDRFALRLCTANLSCCAACASLDDPAVAVLREFPQVRVIECRTETPNAQGRRADGSGARRRGIRSWSSTTPIFASSRIIWSASPRRWPIRASGWSRACIAPTSSTFAARFEGLGVSTDFAPSALVARHGGRRRVRDGLDAGVPARGSGAHRRLRGDRAIISPTIISSGTAARAGTEVRASDVIVDTHLGGSWRDVWRHQVRWARTIRVSKIRGLSGIAGDHTRRCGRWWPSVCGRLDLALALLAVRMLMAMEAGWIVMRSRDVLRLWLA